MDLLQFMEAKSLSEALREALSYYKKQIVLAEERIQLFEDKIMSVQDIDPPVRDTTAEAIENEQRLMDNYRRGVKIIEDLFARDEAFGRSSDGKQGS